MQKQICFEDLKVGTWVICEDDGAFGEVVKVYKNRAVVQWSADTGDFTTFWKYEDPDEHWTIELFKGERNAS